MNNLLIRTEITSEIGAGHFMRCIALAQAWKQWGGNVFFLLSSESQIPPLTNLLEGFEILRISVQTGSMEDAVKTQEIAVNQKASWIVLDGYRFGEMYQNSLRSREFSILLIDDYGQAEHYNVDILLNQNMYADEKMYMARADGVRLLLGTKYVLLRNEFKKWYGYKRKNPDRVTKILVTTGGSDQKNTAILALRALRKTNTPSFEVQIIAGFSEKLLFDLVIEKKECPFPVSIIKNVHDMPPLITWADLAISAAGSTCWELAYLGLPSIIVSLACNQDPVAEVLEQKNISRYVGRIEDVTEEKIQKNVDELLNSRTLRDTFSANGQAHVDCFGSDRVVMTMKRAKIRLRPAIAGDSKMLLTWANDPVVRSCAFETDQIDPETHARWFDVKLKSGISQIYIAENTDDIPVGQIRFECNGQTADVDISVDVAWRHQGIGVEILKRGLERFLAVVPVRIVTAYVKTTNIASRKMFESAGFLCKEIKCIKGVEVYFFIFMSKESEIGRKI